MRRFISSLLVLVALAFFTGCASSKSQADKLNQAIHDKTEQIVQSATDASGHVADADQKLADAMGVEGNPTETIELMTGARGDLGSAQQSLAPIIPAAATIDQKSDQAAAVTSKVQDKLDDERNHFVGYKGRVILWSLAGLLPIIAVVLFIIRTNGGGPILAALGQVVGSIIPMLMKGVVALAKFLMHLFTLGSLKLADITNKKYDEQQVTASKLAQDLLVGDVVKQRGKNQLMTVDQIKMSTKQATCQWFEGEESTLHTDTFSFVDLEFVRR